MEEVKEMYFEELETMEELDAAGCGAAFGIGFLGGVVVYAVIAT